MTAGAHAATLDPDAVLVRDRSGAPTFLRGSLGVLDLDLERGEAAGEFLRTLAVADLGASGREGFKTRGVQRDELGYVHVRLDQTIHGLPVVGSQVVVHADDLTGEVYAVSGRFVAAGRLPVRASLEAGRALEITAGQAGVALEKAQVVDGPQLVYVLDADDQPRLAWRVRLAYEGQDGPEIDDLFADAATGALVNRHPQVHRAKSWQTYDAHNGDNLPGTLVCTNTQLCGDSVLQSIHDHASDVYDYYLTKFSRSSYNGSGSTIRSVGHYEMNENNAYWSAGYLLFGDGDGSRWAPLGNAFDIVAHEFTHGVTQSESGLIYQKESGALNEAWSDIFGTLAEIWRDGLSANSWKMGEDAFTPGTPGDALRYMNLPTQDGYSKDYYPERLYPGACSPGPNNDNCGVHGNSGIANLAFYLSVNGGQHPRGKTTFHVSAVGLNRAEHIFYRAQTNYLTPNSNFLAAREATAQAALDLYGAAFRDRMYGAWCAVGVGSCPSGGTLDDAQFIAVSVPSLMTPGQTASVSVTMKNVGTTTWTRATGYKLGSQNPQDSSTWGFTRVLLPNGVSVAPGQQHTFNFTITAPSSPGTYQFQWRMLQEFVHWFGAFSTNRQIVVQNTLNIAQFISYSGVPTNLARGQSATVSVTMRNVGTSTWTPAAGHKLGSENPRDNTTWGTNRVWLPNGVSVAPGQQHTFTFTITAPNTAGTYNFQWRMLQEQVQWFGEFSLNRQIVVN